MKNRENFYPNEGKLILKRLNSFSISEPKCVVDVGANFGEISLYFSKIFPSCKIVSIEASPENLQIMKETIGTQIFPTNNIIVAPVALSDKNGWGHITTGLGSENSMIVDQTRTGKLTEGLAKIETIDFKSLWDRYDLGVVDFMKIDIEGAEPLLAKGLKEKINNIKSVLIEISDKNEKLAYYNLLDAIDTEKMVCYNHNDETLQPLTIQEVKDMIKNDIYSDYWFINKAYVE